MGRIARAPITEENALVFELVGLALSWLDAASCSPREVPLGHQLPSQRFSERTSPGIRWQQAWRLPSKSMERRSVLRIPVGTASGAQRGRSPEAAAVAKPEAGTRLLPILNAVSGYLLSGQRRQLDPHARISRSKRTGRKRSGKRFEVLPC